jgi:hypothetical protein
MGDQSDPISEFTPITFPFLLTRFLPGAYRRDRRLLVALTSFDLQLLLNHTSNERSTVAPRIDFCASDARDASQLPTTIPEVSLEVTCSLFVDF